MNVDTIEKKTIVIGEELLKYETVVGLFKILYNVCKMLNAEQHFDYCYCNLTKNQCWLCKFRVYVKFNDIKENLLRYRENEDRLLDIAYKFSFYIKKIKKDKLGDDEKFVLDFFNQEFNCKTTSFDEVIRNDIIEFNRENMK